MAAGGDASTGDVATADDPVITDVTSPVAGAVTITEIHGQRRRRWARATRSSTRRLDIHAPTTIAADPLTLVFTVDAALLAIRRPRPDADTLTVFRNAVPVEACTGAGATPDPCVSRARR